MANDGSPLTTLDTLNNGRAIGVVIVISGKVIYGGSPMYDGSPRYGAGLK
jgi:hypothetical protein